MKNSGFVVLVLLLVAFCGLCAGSAVDYATGNIVPLPQSPYTDCTNKDAATLVFDDVSIANDATYISAVENTLETKNWKEWLIIYSITPTAADWYIDLKVDYCTLVDNSGDEYLFARDAIDYPTGETVTALWDTLSSSSTQLTDDMSYIGYPSTTTGAGMYAKAKLDTLQSNTPDVIVDTCPFNWNPAWVSLEFTGKNVEVSYEFYDWCVPEPGTLAFLALGALTFMRRRF